MSAFPLTKAAGQFVAALRFEQIPAAAVAVVKNGVTDCAGTTILGRNEEVTRIVRDRLVQAGASGESRLVFSLQRASAPQAALVNGVAGHAHDYDDIGIGAHPAHPSVAIATAVMAEGEALRAPGRELIAAYVAGYELWAELAHRDKAPHNLAGWHTTGVFGAVAASAAVARLRKLDAQYSAHAIAIGVSHAAGLVTNFGTMTKPLHAGRAAQAGIEAARLASAGFTASPTALEAVNGFLKSYSPQGEVDLERAPLWGSDWWLLRNGLGFKLYPVCYANHRALDGILDLVAEHDIKPAHVDEIEFEMGPGQALNLSQHDPRSVLDAKFSGEFSMAAAVVARRVTMSELTESFVRRDDVRALMQRVRLTVLPGKNRPYDLPPDHVRVKLKDGRLLARELDWPRGHPEKPLAGNQLWDKFAGCVEDGLPGSKAREMFDRLQRLERLESFDELPLVTG